MDTAGILTLVTVTVHVVDQMPDAETPADPEHEGGSEEDDSEDSEDDLDDSSDSEEE